MYSFYFKVSFFITLTFLRYNLNLVQFNCFFYNYLNYNTK